MTSAQNASLAIRKRRLGAIAASARNPDGDHGVSQADVTSAASVASPRTIQSALRRARRNSHARTHPGAGVAAALAATPAPSAADVERSARPFERAAPHPARTMPASATIASP
jgi:hypothetical protein